MVPYSTIQSHGIEGHWRDRDRWLAANCNNKYHGMVDTTDMLQQRSGALLAVIPVSGGAGAHCDRK